MSREKLQNCKLKILAWVALVTTCLFLLPALPAQAEDADPFLLRALVLADFRSDETAPTPEISYLLPGEKPTAQPLLDSYTKVVTIFDPAFGIGGVQAVFRAPVYQITDADRTLTQPSFKRGVGGVIADAGIILAKEDQVEPALSSSAAGNSIKITRVSVAEIENFETLPYQTKEIDDPTLERPLTKVAQEGKTGKKRYLYEVRRENGVEVSRDLIKEEVVEKPQDKIIKRGTKIVVLSSISGRASWTKGVTAMRRYKKGTLIRVTSKASGKAVEVTVGGWGPQEETGRILDLEQDAFAEIADLGAGLSEVLVEELKR